MNKDAEHLPDITMDAGIAARSSSANVAILNKTVMYFQIPIHTPQKAETVTSPIEAMY